jgi:fused signal recognition particle receptor
MSKWFKRKKKKKSKTSGTRLESRGQVPQAQEAGDDEVPGSGAEAASEDDEGVELTLTEVVSDEEEAHDEWHADSEWPLEREEEPDDEEKGRFFRQLRSRMHKTRENLAHRVDRLVLGKRALDEDLLDELEEILVTSDLGVQTSQRLLKAIADKVKRKELRDTERLCDQLREEVQAILSVEGPSWNPRRERPFVIMVIGVNGVGKTTTIGKLARRLKDDGLSVALVAGDTFRAAAVEQLVQWGERIDVPVIRQRSGSDPSAVAFDALEAAVNRKVDVVITDTAGRMHTKVNLMEELKKMRRVMKKKIPSAPHEVLLVLDASTGQNALSQARLFKNEMEITGLILTKLDGTAKGGVIVPICDELQVPVRYIGVGESVEDLKPFDPEAFSKALL